MNDKSRQTEQAPDLPAMADSPARGMRFRLDRERRTADSLVENRCQCNSATPEMLGYA
jgi:hypothetical protein